MGKIKTLTLFKTIQRYYCLVIYAFMLCLYGVITISAFLCGSGDMAIACDFVLPLLLIASCVVTAVCAYGLHEHYSDNLCTEYPKKMRHSLYAP